MNTLREDLHALAEQAPAVDLAARAVRGARRRRATRLAVAAAAVFCLIAGGGAVLSQVLVPERPIVLTPPETKALPLPAKGVEPVEHAYLPACRPAAPCGKRLWRIVTRGGDTYELAEAPEARPLEITADGRRLVYYSAGQRRIVVRDLAGGQVWKAPLKQPPGDFSVEYALRLSPDGLRFVVSGWGGGRDSNKLVDVARGTVTDLERGWWPVSVANGSGPVVLARTHDATGRVRVLGHDPVTAPAASYSYSALAPDGRTLVQLGQTIDRNRQPMVRRDGSIVVFDAVRGGRATRVPVSGLAEGLVPARLGGWVSATEVTLLTVPESGGRQASAVYAVDVRTGRSRELFAMRGGLATVVPGLVD